ncbi:MAG: ISAs1 family transposase [Moorea sp. SIO2B7]|nr:ISAs1 family transposase [Moorena sp. SIO2B7]
MHYTVITTKTIIDSKNDYLITVKKNQIKLYNSLKYLAELEKPLNVDQQKELNHGRKIKRKISVYDGKKVKHKNYPHLQSFLKVERLRLRGNKEYNETLYYISSRKLLAEIFAQRIKGHWSIENQIHWVKDVIFKEYKSRFKKAIAANFSLLVTLVMNLYRSLGFISITEGQDWLGNNWEKLLTI